MTASVSPLRDRPAASMPGPAAMALVDHLEELRWRLIKVLAMVAVAAAGAFCVQGAIIGALLRPAAGIQVVVTTPIEGFKTALLVALYAGLVVVLPGALYQGAAFLGPGLQPAERRWLGPMIAASLSLFAGGAALAYWVLLPTALHFLVGFTPGDVRAMWSLGQYVGFAAALLFAAGTGCQLPIVLVALGLAGIVNAAQLTQHRRHAMVGAVALGMVASPSPDLITQGLMAAVAMGLYEASALVLSLAGR